MKKSRFFVVLAIIVALLMMLASGCSSATKGEYGAADGIYGGGMADALAPGAGGEEGAEGEDAEQNEVIKILPGQLTVCAYNDNEHFEFWQGLLGQDGEFFNHYNNFTFSAYHRIALQLTKGVYAQVSLVGEDGGVEHSAVADANGVCYLFTRSPREEYQIKITTFNQGEAVATEHTVTGDSQIEISGDGFERAIQLMFVVDATGSMGDEMSYLKSEIVDVISKVSAENEGYQLELAIMVYRDYGDNYVTKFSEFTQDVSAQQTFLSKQSASGGGDFEEAVQTALSEAAANQYWKDGATKILVHVADAPAHNEDVTAWKNAVHSLSSKGVRIITVASSGIDKKTEYFFRCQSAITNGHYLYLTNHSGIGGDHIDATVEVQPVVEYLNSCLIRIINGYVSGEFAPPTFYGNDVQNG